MDWFLRVVQGALIGVGAILPGISGGVLCVIFGIYKPMMAFLAHPLRSFKRYFPLLLPVGIGWAVGVLLLANVVDWLFRTSPTPAIWLFIGLITGTLPSLWKEAGTQGRPRSAWIALVLAGALMGGWLLLMSQHGTTVTPNVFWWILCGALWGIGLIVPGLSPSSFFIFFGLYQPMTAGIGHLDLTILLPLAGGLLLSITLLARGMNLLMARAYAIVMHAILGIVIASTIAIIPTGGPAGFWDIVLYIACFAAGCAVAFWMGWVGAKTASTKAEASENAPEKPAS